MSRKMRMANEWYESYVVMLDFIPQKNGFPYSLLIQQCRMKLIILKSFFRIWCAWDELWFVAFPINRDTRSYFSQPAFCRYEFKTRQTTTWKPNNPIKIDMDSCGCIYWATRYCTLFHRCFVADARRKNRQTGVVFASKHVNWTAYHALHYDDAIFCFVLNNVFIHLKINSMAADTRLTNIDSVSMRCSTSVAFKAAAVQRQQKCHETHFSWFIDVKSIPAWMCVYVCMCLVGIF